MMRKTDLHRLADMLAAGERSVRHVGGRTAAELAADELRADATLYALGVMGEACKHVSGPARGRFPAVPWRAVAGMRDRLFHGYDDIDWDIVAETVARFVPAAVDELRLAIAALSADPRPPEVP